MSPNSLVVRWLSSRLADAVTKMVAAIALVISLVVGVQLYQLNTCQVRYNEASNASTRERAEAYAADRQAIDDVIAAIAADPQEGLAAVRAYDARRAQADRQRDAAPVPPPPSETCG
ncbi:hypothetical protein ACQPZJ_01810 [Actinoplanes sp. CA-054009]